MAAIKEICENLKTFSEISHLHECDNFKDMHSSDLIRLQKRFLGFSQEINLGDNIVYNERIFLPEPGFVFETTNESTIVFINVCSNELIDKPKSIISDLPKKCLIWVVPFTLSPPRNFQYSFKKKKNNNCRIYDIVFNFDILRLAETNHDFKMKLNYLIYESLHEIANEKINHNDYKEINSISYKGIPVTMEITDVKNVELTSSQSIPDLDITKNTFHHGEQVVHKLSHDLNHVQYIMPKFYFKNVNNVDYTCMNENMFKSEKFTVVVELPLLTSTKHIDLELFQSRILLISDKSPNYKLDISLPCFVNVKKGTAKFYLKKKFLIITLESAVFCKLSNKLELHKYNNTSHFNFQEKHIDEKLNDNETNIPISNNDFNERILPEYETIQVLETVTFKLPIPDILPETLIKHISEKKISLNFTAVKNKLSRNYSFFSKFQDDIIVEKSILDLNNCNLILVLFKKHNKIWNKCFISSCESGDIIEHSFSTEQNLINEIRNILTLPAEIHSESFGILQDETNSGYVTVFTNFENAVDQNSDSIKKGILKTDRSRSYSESSAESSLTSSILSSSLPATPDVDEFLPRRHIRQKSVSFSDHVEQQSFKQNSSVIQLHKTLLNRKKKAKKREIKDGRKRRYSSGENISSSEDIEANNILQRTLSADAELVKCFKSINLENQSQSVSDFEKTINNDKLVVDNKTSKRKKRNRKKKIQENIRNAVCHSDEDLTFSMLH